MTEKLGFIDKPFPCTALSYSQMVARGELLITAGGELDDLSNRDALAVSYYIKEQRKKCMQNTTMISVRQAFEGGPMRRELARALPGQVDLDRFVRVSMTTLQGNPKLLECSQVSLLKCLIQAGQLGLEPDGGPLGLAYLVPYGDEATLIIGYRGLIQLARNSPQVDSIYTNVVREGDHFDYIYGVNQKLEHKQAEGDGPITHVYCMVHLKGGGVQFRVWNTPSINAHMKRYSQAWQRAERTGKKDSPWHTHWDSMARKTVIRDMCARGEIPLQVEQREAVAQREPFTIDVQSMGEPDDTPPAIETSLETEIAEKLERCEDVTACNELEANYAAKIDPQQLPMLAGLCDLRRENIRAARGPQS